LVLIGQKLPQDRAKRELALGRNEGGGMREALEDLWRFPARAEGATGQAVFRRGPSGGACIALIRAGQVAQAGIQRVQRGGLGQEGRGEVCMEPLGRRRFQPPGGLDRTQRRDRRIVIGGQGKPQPHGKLLMEEVGLGAGIGQLHGHTAEITARQHDVDVVAVGVGVARGKPAMRMGIDRQSR